MKHLATPLAFEAHAGPGSSPHGAPRAPARRRAVEAAAAVLLAAAGRARAQAFPARPLRLVVPFPPGGPTDIVARPLAQLLADALRQQVVVDNRGGAGGSIGADAVAKAPSDGYTLLMGTVGTHAINASLYRRLPYDPVKDFTALGLVASAPVAVVVPAASPFASVADLVAAARREPDAIAFGSAGNGTPGHLTGELFAKAAGVNVRHVPYKGSAPAVTDLLGGQVQMMFDNIPSALPHIRAGKLRALATTGAKRDPALPDLPTVAEAGVQGYESGVWFGLTVPAGTPKDVIAKLSAEAIKATKSPDFVRRMTELGYVILGTTPEQMAEMTRTELLRWPPVVKASGAALD